MLDWTEYAKICLALIVIVNPVVTVPLFTSMTATNAEEEKNTLLRSPALHAPCWWRWSASGNSLHGAACEGKAFPAFQ